MKALEGLSLSVKEALSAEMEDSLLFQVQVIPVKRDVQA